MSVIVLTINIYSPINLYGNFAGSSTHSYTFQKIYRVYE